LKTIHSKEQQFQIDDDGAFLPSHVVIGNGCDAISPLGSLENNPITMITFLIDE